MSVVYRAYAQIKNVDERTFILLFDGNRISNDDTPESLDLEEDDEIDSKFEMSGD